MSAGPLTNDQRSQEYYRIALKCQELSNRKNGCDHQCARCTLNVHLYIDNVKDATLIKTSAGIDWQRGQMIKAHQSGEALGQLIWTIILVGMLVVGIWWPISCVKKTLKPATAPTAEYTEVISDAAWQRVQIASVAALAIKKDISNDGLLNCIDYALRFYEMFGADCRIMWVIAPDNSFSHLYVAVPNGYDQYIHLDSSRSGTLRYMLMSNVFSWYHKAEKYDVTNYYKQLKNNTFVWRTPL